MEEPEMTPEERARWDESCRLDAESEMMAERYNEMVMSGVNFGPDPDDAFERYLESQDEFLQFLRAPESSE